MNQRGKAWCLFFILLSLLISCTHKETREVKVEAAAKPQPLPDEKMIDTYYRLIEGIKKKDLNKIRSCYLDQYSYEYSEKINPSMHCFNGELKIENDDQIIQQFRSLFQKRLLDNIEFDIRQINRQQLSITFINAWAYSDYHIAETIYFKKKDDHYLINRHIVHQYD